MAPILITYSFYSLVTKFRYVDIVSAILVVLLLMQTNFSETIGVIFI